MVGYVQGTMVGYVPGTMGGYVPHWGPWWAMYRTEDHGGYSMSTLVGIVWAPWWV